MTPTRAMGTTRMTAAGLVQLSYWAGQDQEDQGDGQGIDEVGLVAHLLFLVGRGRPVVGDALGQVVFRHLFHEVQGLAGAEARGGRAEHRHRGIEVVAGDQLGAQHPLDVMRVPRGTISPLLLRT